MCLLCTLVLFKGEYNPILKKPNLICRSEILNILLGAIFLSRYETYFIAYSLFIHLQSTSLFFSGNSFVPYQ